MMFSGLSAFPITPANEAGEVDIRELAGLLERLKIPGVGSVGLLGSTGTFAYLSRSERRRAVDVAVEVLNRDVPLIVGVGALRTDEACAHARDAKAAGADALLMAPVSYTPLTQEEAYQHYKAVASVTDLPLCIYNNPGTTHFTFDLDLLVRLAALDTVSAVKMPLPAARSLGEDLEVLRAALPAEFAVGYSGDWGCGEALLCGADTWYSVIGGLLPELAASLAQAARRGDEVGARRIDMKLAPFWALFKEFGSLRVVYAAAGQMGLTTCSLPRPLLPLERDAESRVAAALETLAD
ncbi:dihydrodipicolinate synthase family protein [Roseibium aquae]|uniref:Dihydrodipicolinate synthase family protein n=1 Tax=Roseibium aquae TaxID=1323746 RepID=A0A916TJX9_9HYPH|nr:dihydrodipicolinate synthase family protein [Roseibium aquae]GGB49686.1 dihydrodipicolinate synthase family protein [Roseibium aquae]